MGRNMICKWVVRPGKCDTFWAYTTCKSGFNYLSRISRAADIKAMYDGRLCPICGGIIKCNTELVENY